LVLGFGAALVQAFFKVVPPVAYGFCTICHAGDLVNWLANHIFHAHWNETFHSGTALTVIGVLAGALLAAIQHGELHVRVARQSLLYFFAGFITVKFGQFLGGCPIRVVLLTAYGSLMGIVGLASVAIGVGLGTMLMRWHARRAVDRVVVPKKVVA
jgi:hypothetical protein